MKKILLIIIAALVMATPAGAVLKEKDLKQTLSILREELTTFHNEQARQSLLFKRQSEQVRTSLFSILQRSNQNALMLYSQKPDYVFDLTYACNEASDQYHEFKTKALPFRTFIGKLEWEIARYDSLIQSLKTMPVLNLDEKAKIDRNVCLTLATNIKNTMEENQQQHSKSKLQSIDSRNLTYIKQEEERILKWEHDMLDVLENQIHILRKAIQQAERDARNATNVEEKLKAERKVDDLKRKRRRLRNEMDEREDEIGEKRKAMINDIEKKLVKSITDEAIFMVRWQTK